MPIVDEMLACQWEGFTEAQCREEGIRSAARFKHAKEACTEWLVAYPDVQPDCAIYCRLESSERTNHCAMEFLLRAAESQRQAHMHTNLVVSLSVLAALFGGAVWLGFRAFRR